MVPLPRHGVLSACSFVSRHASCHKAGPTLHAGTSSAPKKQSSDGDNTTAVQTQTKATAIIVITISTTAMSA